MPRYEVVVVGAYVEREGGGLGRSLAAWRARAPGRRLRRLEGDPPCWVAVAAVPVHATHEAVAERLALRRFSADARRSGLGGAVAMMAVPRRRGPST